MRLREVRTARCLLTTDRAETTTADTVQYSTVQYSTVQYSASLEVLLVQICSFVNSRQSLNRRHFCTP